MLYEVITHASQRRNRLLDVNYMQSYFTGRVESMLARLGRTPIGWNEIAEGASKSTIVQAWYHVEVGIEMSQQGFQVICSPIEPYYLNYHHDYNTLEKVYSFDPIVITSYSIHYTKLYEAVSARAIGWPRPVITSYSIHYTKLYDVHRDRTVASRRIGRGHRIPPARLREEEVQLRNLAVAVFQLHRFVVLERVLL